MHKHQYQENLATGGDRIRQLFLVTKDQTALDTLNGVLAREGSHFSMQCAHSVEDARQRLQSLTPDIAILDINLDNGKSLQLLSAVKNRNKFCHTVMLAGSDEKELAVNALKLGADDYYDKPLEPAKVLRDLHTVMDYQSLRQEKLITQARFSAAFDQSSLWLFIIDSDGNILDINRSALRSLHNPAVLREHFIGMPLWQAPWWKREHYTQKRLQQAMQRALQGKDYHGQIEIHHDGDRSRCYELVMRIIKGGATAPVSILVECRDITQFKHNEENLQQYRFSLEHMVRERTREYSRAQQLAEMASDSKTEFLYRMSHELRTQLNSIMGFAQLLKADLATTVSTEEQYSNTNEILDAAGHVVSLVDEIIDLSKIEAGKFDIQLHDMALDESVAGVLADLEPVTREQRIKLKNEITAGDRYYVKSDPNALQHILLNLIDNAIKYGGEHARITLSVEQINNKVRIAVRDNGDGIPGNKLDSLFQPFERLEQHRHLPGSGIGLTICKKLVEEMGGTIGASSAMGKGSTFWFDLDIS